MEVTQAMEEIVRDTKNRGFPAFAERGSNPCPQCHVILLKPSKTSMLSSRYWHTGFLCSLQAYHWLEKLEKSQPIAIDMRRK